MLPKTKKSKKAVSVIIGYVLLVAFAVIIGGITYTWIKTYVPSQQNLECQDGVSVFVKKSVYNDTSFQLKITVKNTGRFSIGGYFIHATNESSQKLATIDLSGYLNKSFGGENLSNSVLFVLGVNYLKSGEEADHVFDIPSELGTLHNVKITPIRFQEVDNRNRFVSCQNSITEQVIGEDVEPGECVPDDLSLTCGSRICGSVVNNCDNLVSCPPDNCEDSGLVCDGTGECVTLVECTDTCSSLGYECGTQTICGSPVDCNVEVGGCTTGSSCNVAGQCVTNCGNSVIDTGDGEECDDGGLENDDGCSSTCKIEDGWTCDEEPSVCQLCGNNIREGTEQCDDGNTIDNDQCKNDCTLSPTTDCSSNCISQDSSWGYCTSNSECNDRGGTNPFSGNQYCGAGEGKCCCIP